jgi:hypothetical protein
MSRRTTIDFEIVQDKIVTVTQKPIIAYDLIEAKSKEVTEKIQSLDLENIEANEDNLRLLKSTRTDLSKEHKELEEQRKLVKDLIMKPYNDFEEAYKKKISDYFKRADVVLKEKIDSVESATLQIKIDGIKEYFDEINTHDFIRFEELGFKIIKSKSDKSIKDEIDEYLLNIATSLETIKTVANSERVLAKFQMHKDLNRAISETNIEVERERKIAEQKELQKAQEEAQRVACEAKQAEIKQQVQELITEEPGQAAKKLKMTFEVSGTIEQLRALKSFLVDNNIEYKGV